MYSGVPSRQASRYTFLTRLMTSRSSSTWARAGQLSTVGQPPVTRVITQATIPHWCGATSLLVPIPPDAHMDLSTHAGSAT
jgi:hypothetical protein